jgi:hypothetical protein
LKRQMRKRPGCRLGLCRGDFDLPVAKVSGDANRGDRRNNRCEWRREGFRRASGVTPCESLERRAGHAKSSTTRATDPSAAVGVRHGRGLQGGAIPLAGGASGGTVYALCKGRRTMACMISSLFLFAMFGVVAAAVTFITSTREKPSARRQETPAAPAGDHVIA